MAIRKIMVCYVALYLAYIHQSNAGPSLTCYKFPPSNNPTPPIVDKYRKRYYFVQKKSALPSSSPSTISSSVVSVHCPWKWVVDDEANRLPQMMVYATCDKCDNVSCKPVKFNHQVVYKECDYRTGEVTWRWTNEEMAVAFIYAKQ